MGRRASSRRRKCASAHIGDVHAVTDGVVELLGEDGVFISESHYLLDLVETLQYDTIYHEHLRYYSLGALEVLLKRHGLEVFHVKRIPTHGGSIRVYAARPGRYPVNASVEERRRHEAEFGLTDGSALKVFRERVVKSKIAPLRPAREAVSRRHAHLRHRRTLARLDADQLHRPRRRHRRRRDGSVGFAKLNRYVPGTRIPVDDEAEAVRRPARLCALALLAYCRRACAQAAGERLSRQARHTPAGAARA